MEQPQAFGPYLLKERLAMGGMAEVFLATSPQADAPLLVVKRLHGHLAEGPEFLDMFADEARITGRLNHPGIAKLLDLGIVDGAYYLAMEYVPGPDLADFCYQLSGRGMALTPAQALHIIGDLAESLDYAHRATNSQGAPLGIVHRDVSPQNVMITPTGAVKIIDFGIAKADRRSSETETGVVKGKFGYMSPEQVTGDVVDARSDVFAMGILLYELLTGRALFEGDSVSVLHRIRNVDVPLITSVIPDIAPEVVTIVHRALAADLAHRFQSAGDLADAARRTIAAIDPTYSRKSLAALVAHLFGDNIARRGMHAGPVAPPREVPQIPAAVAKAGPMFKGTNTAPLALDLDRVDATKARKRADAVRQRVHDHRAETARAKQSEPSAGTMRLLLLVGILAIASAVAFVEFLSDKVVGSP